MATSKEAENYFHPMNQLKNVLASNEEWLKKLVLEFAGSADAESGWPDFFARLLAATPEVCNEDYVLMGALDAAGLPALVLDASLAVKWSNQAAVKLLGNGAGLPLEELAPWVADEVSKECSRSVMPTVVRFDVPHPGGKQETLFSVTLSGCEGGWVLLLDDITSRVEAQRQLVRERNKSAMYLDVVGTMVVTLDASGAVTMVNETGCRVLGYGMYELIGRNWVEAVVPEEQRDEVLDFLYHVHSGQADMNGELTYYVTTKDGEDRLVLWQHKQLVNEGGLPIGILCSGMDITEQRASEEALAEKELWLRSTFVALGEAVLILTPEWDVLDANPAAETMFGMTNEELVDSPVDQLHVDAVHGADFMVRSRDAFEKGERAFFEFPMRRKNGEVFPSEHSVSLIIGDDGHPLGIVNTVRDISARKRSERVLRESEEKFRRIFDSIEEGYIVTDLKGRIQMVNPATCRLLGYAEGELVGKSMARLYHDKDKQKLLRSALLKGEAIRGLQAQISRKDGAVITVDGNAHAVVDDNGTVVGLEGTFRDITRHMEAEKVLMEREQQYRAFFENNHAIMILADPKTGKVVDANPAATSFYGYSREEMQGLSMSRINALSEEEVFKEMELAREEKRAYFILKHSLADGSVRDVEVYSGPIMVQGSQLLYSVIHDVTSRIRLENEMKTLATTDALTGVDNRHQFFSLGSRELSRALRYKKPLSLLMLDIDYFKSINDTYGHQAGDEVLRELARTASSLLRETDVFGRLGGEEFAVVLPETGLKLGMEVAERLRSGLAEARVEFEGRQISFTVSIGATLARRSDRAIEDVIKRADEALYKAKRMGRNRVDRG